MKSVGQVWVQINMCPNLRQRNLYLCGGEWLNTSHAVVIYNWSTLHSNVWLFRPKNINSMWQHLVWLSNEVSLAADLWISALSPVVRLSGTEYNAHWDIMAFWAITRISDIPLEIISHVGEEWLNRVTCIRGCRYATWPQLCSAVLFGIPSKVSQHQ